MLPTARPSQEARSLESANGLPPDRRNPLLEVPWAAVRETFQRIDSEATRRAAAVATADVAEGGWRVLRSVRFPTRQGLIEFFTHQVLVNVVGWAAGLATAHVVTRLFEVRGFRNLWGLAASGERALVSADDHRLITTVTGFTVGLLMMLFVRHILMRWISETRALRAERRRGEPAEHRDPPLSTGPSATHFDELEVEPEP